MLPYDPVGRPDYCAAVTNVGSRPLSILALVAVSIAAGAVVGLVGASFLWAIDELIRLVWIDLSDALGVDDPTRSWYLFAVPLVGGLLVGLGQMLLGNYPEAIERVLARWKAGGEVDPKTIGPATINSFSAIVMGGPVGFEAALTGILGGLATLVGRTIRGVGPLLRQAWGSERVENVPKVIHNLPYWLAGIAGLLTYKWLPFGKIAVDFRFDAASKGDLGVNDALIAVLFAAAVAIPAAWAIQVASKAENATFYRRSPVLVAMAGGLLFAVLALGNEYVLFSGQQGIQHLQGESTAELLYLAVAKWAAMCIAFFCGWRGGPIFPTFIAVASLAEVFDGIAGVSGDIIMVSGIAAVSAVVFKGRIAGAFILSLYVVPLTYGIVTLIGAVSATVALALVRPVGGVPEVIEEPVPVDD